MDSLKASSMHSLVDSEHGSNDSLLAESLQLDIAELDDEEYAIPIVDPMPTLESVLNDIDSDLDSVSAMGIQSDDHGAVMETWIADDEPVCCSSVKKSSTSLDNHVKLESILRHVVLQGVTAQLTSAVDRVDAGLATSCAVSLMIALGTSHGHILAFDCTQTLKWCCQEGTTQGAVASLSFNEDNSRLLVGFARGGILMIDTQTGDVIRTLNDVITPNTGVLHLKWTNRPNLALCSDSGGSVWSLNFTRRLGIRGCDSRCLFSGARGEVCTIEPLLLGEEEHPLKTYTLVALATLSKFFVVLIRPRLKVVRFHPMISYPDCLPLLAWQMVLIQAADSTRTIDPVLAAARGSDLFFHQVTYHSGRISLLFLRHIELSYSLLAIHWLGPKSLACLDTKEILHLSDVRTNNELEKMDLSNVGLMYNSAQFKGLATGGNVSPALALAGTAACYNTVVSQGNQLYFLGGKSLHAISARAWSDRLSYLASMQRWDEAIELAIEGYRAAGSRHRRRVSSKERIIRMYEEYLNATRKHPEHCLKQIVECLIEIDEKQLLWEELYDRLSCFDDYLRIIANHVENEHLNYIAPCVAQVLFEYFWKKGETAALEAMILKLNWQCMDLHQVLTICRKEKLYRAQMYLNAKALGDYTISLIDLIPQIELTTGDLELGNCILVYISSCLAGRGYPSGEIATETIPNVKHEVLRCLTVIHSKNAPEDEPSYPYLKKLLDFDTRETLNVISLAFQEKEFNGELGLSQRQRIINILLDILAPDNATWSQIGALLNFIAQQISSGDLPESDMLLGKVLTYLTIPPEVTLSRREHFEREQTWLELLCSNCLDHIPTEQLLEIARKNKCYHVVEHLLERLEKFEDIFECYLLDEHRQLQLFTYISHHATDPKRKIYPLVVENLCQIVDINCEQAGRVLVENYMRFLGNFLKILDHAAVPERFFHFLTVLIKLSVQLETTDLERYLELLCQYRPDEVTNFLKSNDSYRLDNAIRTIKRFELSVPLIFLYEKQGDYQSAYDVAVKSLKGASDISAEIHALQVNALCMRASAIMTESDREVLWFSLLNIVLSRNDLTSVTKNILHSASEFVDLSKLVQLVLNSGTQTGNFGDIKHLLIGMLSNSAYESLLIQTTSLIMGGDLHSILAKERKFAMRGLVVKTIKCIVCRSRLCNTGKESIVVMGNCGHAMHQQCAYNFSALALDKNTEINKHNDIQSSEAHPVHSTRNFKCTRCDTLIIESSSMNTPEYYVEHGHLLQSDQVYENKANTLKLSAPPRVG